MKRFAAACLVFTTPRKTVGVLWKALPITEAKPLAKEFCKIEPNISTARLGNALFVVMKRQVRQTERKKERETERDRQTERERQRERERERQRQRDRERQRETETETETERDHLLLKSYYFAYMIV
jgi:hypothetical protein